MRWSSSLAHLRAFRNHLETRCPPFWIQLSAVIGTWMSEFQAPIDEIRADPVAHTGLGQLDRLCQAYHDAEYCDDPAIGGSEEDQTRRPEHHVVCWNCEGPHYNHRCRKPKRCKRCGSYDHFISVCTNTTCDVCGLAGHSMGMCHTFPRGIDHLWREGTESWTYSPTSEV